MPIVACSTPPGISGIAVVRVSGKGALKNVSSFIKSAALNKKSASSGVHLLVDEDGNAFDEALITTFINPHSYTGENMVEISCHGNPVIVSKIIDLSLAAGASLAEPGEFTKKAYLNGKIDLSEAEAVSSIIHSRSIAGVKAGVKNLKGGLSKKINVCKKALISVVANLEFNLDISEEGLQPNLIKNSSKTVSKTVSSLMSLLESFNDSRMFQDGASVVILGPPNAGKSTLFNCLVNKDQSIVTDIEGTTRDIIEKNIYIKGLPVLLKDTAGLRKSGNVVEKLGVARSIEESQEADLVILLNYDSKSDQNENSLNIFNKVDIKKPPGDKKYDLCISAKTEKNIGELKNLIYKSLINKDIGENTLLTTKRQYSAISSCVKELENSLSLLSEKNSLELVVEDLNRGIEFLDKITSKTTKDDVLDAVFSSFCVGK